MSSTPSALSAVQTDSPDAAGGEAVFSSDGLPPLPVPPPPLPPRPESGGTYEGFIDTGGVDAAKAFEVFSGRVYLKEDRAETKPLSRRNEGEGALQRLARLSAEVKELEGELASTTTGDAAGGAGADPDELTRMARDLSSRLETLDDSWRVRGEALTELVRKEAERSREGHKATAESTAGAEGEGKGVVYELYSSSAAPSSLEERLIRIESAIGSSFGSRKTVLERLEEAERTAGNADEKRLEIAASRAKVIRADLEAAAKARSKLNSASSLPGVTAEDAAAISSLHEQLQDLEGISSHLPAVVSRLQDLADLHSQAADFAGRLAEAEDAASGAERALLGAEEALARVEGGWKANVEAVERSVKAIDERVADGTASS